MQVPVTDAKAQLTDLVRRAEAGDEVVLTRHGRPAVRLVPVPSTRGAVERRALMEELRRLGSAKAAAASASAARSQDDLYGDDGLPR